MARIIYRLPLLNLLVFKTISISIVPPALKLAFSATVEEILVERGPTSIEQRTYHNVVADLATESIAESFPTADGRLLTMLTRFSQDPGFYQIEPFFGEKVCYKFYHKVEPNSTAQWLSMLYLHILGIDTWPPNNFTLDRTLKVDGRVCTVFTVEKNTSSMYKRVAACIGEEGELLASNMTQILQYKYTIQEIHRTRVFLNYTSDLDPASTTPPSSGCLNLVGNNVSSDDTPVNDPYSIAAAEFAADGRWHAGSNDIFRNLTLGQLKTSRLGAKVRALQLPLAPSSFHSYGDQSTPSEFNAQQHWGRCGSISQIQNQGNCGSCWAFATTTAFADRICIGGGMANLTLSVDYMIDCDRKDNGCEGGYLDDSWIFLLKTGVPTSSCSPYEHCAYPMNPSCTRPQSAQLPPSPTLCPTTCGDASKPVLFQASSAYAVAKPGDVLAMQLEVMNNGPIAVSFFVFSDFMNYRNGTYFRTSIASGPLGGHAVKLLGWGIDRVGTSYWLAANSWSPQWGMAGFFHIRRGVDECGIEATPAAGIFNPHAAQQILI